MDQVNPSYYFVEINGTTYEAKDLINNSCLRDNYNLGNVFKYLIRAKKKDNYELNLKKAIKYLEIEREICQETTGKIPFRSPIIINDKFVPIQDLPISHYLILAIEQLLCGSRERYLIDIEQAKTFILMELQEYQKECLQQS